MRRGRLRFGRREIFPRSDGALPLVRAIRQRAAPSSTCPTWTSACATPPSCRSSACRRPRCWRRRAWRARWTWWCSRWWPRCCPAARGYRVRFLPPWTDFPTDDPLADAPRMNRWIEDADPAQPGAVPVGAQALQDAAAPASRRCTDAAPERCAPIIAPHATALHQDAGRGQRLRRARRHARAARPDARRRCAGWATAASASAPTRSWWSSAAARRASTSATASSTAQRRRGRALRQRRALLRALRARQGPDRQDARVRVETVNSLLELRLQRRRPRHRRHGRAACSTRRACRSTPPGLTPRRRSAASSCGRWTSTAHGRAWPCCRWATRTRCSASTTSTPRRSATLGPLIERHPRFPRRVNAGFMQVRGRGAHPAARVRARRRRDAGLRHRRLRRGGRRHPRWAGSTRRVDVHTRGGLLTIEWAGRRPRRVLMTGPAETVFEGEIEL